MRVYSLSTLLKPRSPPRSLALPPVPKAKLIRGQRICGSLPVQQASFLVCNEAFTPPQWPAEFSDLSQKKAHSNLQLATRRLLTDALLLLSTVSGTSPLSN